MKVDAVLAICPKCNAPYLNPMPKGWSWTVHRRRGGTNEAMPHLPDCPDGFTKVEVGGDDD